MKRLISYFFILTCVTLTCIFSCSPGRTKNFISTDSLSIAGGQSLFQKNCSSCHGFRRDGIGPNLSGITETDSVSWLKEFIRSPKTMADVGDEHTKKLLIDYPTLMPSFAGLKDEELDQLIAYLHTHKERKLEIKDPLAIKDPIPEKIPASNIEAGLELFTTIPPSSDKQPLTRIAQMDWVSPLKAFFVLDQRGKLYKLENQKPHVWLDISQWKPAFIEQPGLATGFGSFAFHPDYAHNGLFYTTHSEAAHTKKADFALPDSVKPAMQWVLCEWKSADPGAPLFKGSCRELLRIDMVSGIHGVQEIIFNPLANPGNEDYGQLYIGVGDGGSVENDYTFLTHHPDKIWGTILRINPLGNNSTNGQYGIPALNPFFKNQDTNTVREIYAEGFRNPNRIGWLKHGEMLATNIGQANIESINIILKGHDYGWPDREGPFLMHPDANMNNLYPLPANDSIYHFTYPAATFDHDEGKAIEGGFEYAGRSIPELKGKFLFGDIPTGRLFYVNTADLLSGKTATIQEWFVSLNGKRIKLKSLCGQDRVDLRFARDEKGEMYIFTKPDGKIYRLIKNKTL